MGNSYITKFVLRGQPNGRRPLFDPAYKRRMYSRHGRPTSEMKQEYAIREEERKLRINGPGTMKWYLDTGSFQDNRPEYKDFRSAPRGEGSGGVKGNRGDS